MARVEVSGDVRGVTGGIISSLSAGEREQYDRFVSSGMTPDDAAQKILREIDEEVKAEQR